MTKAENPIVSLKNARLALRSKAGDVNVLRDVTFEVNRGERVAVVGASGSGKTSLLMVIAGMEPLTDGKANVAGINLNGKSEDQLAVFRRDRIGIVFQSFHLLPAMTALENVAAPLEMKPEISRKDAFIQAKNALNDVGLNDRQEHYPSQLSGGERQRVAIARAVVTKPDVLLADEPTGNLNREIGDKVADLMFKACEKTQAALILVTHDENLAKRCPRIVRMDDGRLKEHPTIHDPE